MTLQTLYDQLLELRIPAFRQALQEQQSNPQFTELAFEERLSLLVDHECTQRRENRIRRNLHTAAFPTSASSGRARSVSRPRTGTTHDPGTGTMQLDPRSPEHHCPRSHWFGEKLFGFCVWQSSSRSGFTVRYHRTSRLLHTLTQVRSDGSLTSDLAFPGKMQSAGSR